MNKTSTSAKAAAASPLTKSLLWKRLVRFRALYLMILPPIVAVFIFHYIPLYGIQIAFKDYRSSLGIWGSEWVGLKHFERFLKYPYMWKLVGNTITINLLSLLTFPLPVMFSLLLNEVRNPRFKKISQTITYAPHFISSVVVCSMIILFLSREGVFGAVAHVLGLNYDRTLMESAKAFPYIYVISDVWTTLGWNTIIYMAALAGVSLELVEAAKIDGATRFGIIRNVYLPHLTPTIITLFILRIGALFGLGADKVLLLQNQLNRDTASIISTYTYEVGLISQQYSYSTAIGLINTVINITLIVIANWVCRKLTETSLW